MFMFPFKVSNGNECLLITNRDELEKFVVFAQSYLALPIMAAGVENEVPEQPSVAPPPVNPVRHVEPTRLTVNDDWISKAWVALGRPMQGVTNRELYQAAQSLGYSSTAKDEFAAFKTAIRISAHLDRVGLRDNVVLWKWTDTPYKARRAGVAARHLSQDAPTTYQGPTDPGLRNPPVGERAIDYAVQALKDTGRPLTTPQLAENMYELGWKTTGDALDTLASTLRKSRYGDIVTNRKGFWVLVGEQSENEESDTRQQTGAASDQLRLPSEDVTTFTQT